MIEIVDYLWVVPTLPLLAAGVLALARRPQRRLAATLAIGAMIAAFFLSSAAFLSTLGGAGHEGQVPQVRTFIWFEMGTTVLRLGWMLDPLTAVMLVMVSLVSTLIFVYSVGYMAHDDNFTRFFCFLSLFAAAMLGLVIADSLLLFFICWELVGLTSYLLIGFWYHKPSAAAAAKKAFITTRIGDLGLLIGMVWLYSQTNTLLFYDQGNGCLEHDALIKLVARTTLAGVSLSTAIGLLIFSGAVGKSGQVPLHVWLPDAMEGPTPVSALIHAATMVAAGVFLIARVFPLMQAGNVDGITPALIVVAWVGAVTAVFAALIAVAQTDIKRILAYSTVSQLGYMMMALGVGGYVAAIFHLITHAFFKALLFLGAGSVIHGCHEEQDIRHLGGLRKYQPVTFATYAIGMMALAGVPVFFSGFWSKDEILHAALNWHGSHGPFYLGLFGAFLTAFYMTRQVAFVFFGEYRGATPSGQLPLQSNADHHPGASRRGVAFSSAHAPAQHLPHESPRVMTAPLQVLAAGAILLGLLGTPAWPWFHGYLAGHTPTLALDRLFEGETLGLMALSIAVVGTGIGLGWWLYGRRPAKSPEAPDILEQLEPASFGLLREKFRVDEIYDATVIQATYLAGRFFHWLDAVIWGGCVQVCSALALGLSWLNRLLDEYVVNLGFDTSCAKVRDSGGVLARLQNGQIQHYLRALGVVLAVLVLVLAWGAWR